MTLNKLIDNLVIARIQSKLKDLEVNDYKYVETFLTKYPELSDDVEIWLNSKGKVQYEKQKDWEKRIKEFDSWIGREKKINIHYMYTRTYELAKIYKSKKPLFQERRVGSISKNDISSILIRLENMWERLCLRIYPELDANFSYETYRKEEKLQSHKGVINWEKTIINSAGSGGFPLEFVCHLPERKYDTPENLLLMVSLYWLRNDAKTLLGYSGFPKLLSKEKNLVEKLFNFTNSVIETTSLQDIREKSNRMSKKMFGDLEKTLLKKVIERIENGLIQDYNYLELKKWVNTYMYFNVEKVAGVPRGVRLDTEQGLNKMYEYWILYEFIAYLENEKKLSCRNITNNEKIAFNILKDGKSIKLIFDMSLKQKQLTTKTNMTPDYGIETLSILPNGNKEIPMVMDAKLYLESQHGEASNKMNRYLDEMSKPNGTKQGILFFPVCIWNEQNQKYVRATKNFIEEELGEKKILSCMICPSNEKEKIMAMYENFDKIYEEYLKSHLE